MNQYRIEEIRDRGIELFRRIHDQYPHHCCVGEGPVFVRVTTTGAQVCVRYRVRGNTAEKFSEVIEQSEAL